MSQMPTVEHDGKAVITGHDLDGTLVDVVEQVWIDSDGARRVRLWEVLPTGTYRISPPYRTEDTARGSRCVSRTDSRKIVDWIAHSEKSAKAALTSARRALREQALIEKHGPLARRLVRTLTVDEFASLPREGTLQPGDIVGVSGHARYRVGVVTSVGPKRAHFVFATPTGGSHVSKGSGKLGEEVRLIRRLAPEALASTPAETTPAEAPATVEAPAIEAETLNEGDAVVVEVDRTTFRFGHVTDVWAYFGARRVEYMYGEGRHRTITAPEMVHRATGFPWLSCQICGASLTLDPAARLVPTGPQLHPDSTRKVAPGEHVCVPGPVPACSGCGATDASLILGGLHHPQCDGHEQDGDQDALLVIHNRQSAGMTVGPRVAMAGDRKWYEAGGSIHDADRALVAAGFERVSPWGAAGAFWTVSSAWVRLAPVKPDSDEAVVEAPVRTDQ